MSSINGLAWARQSVKKGYSSYFFLISEYSLQFGFVHTFPSNVTKVYVTAYIKKNKHFSYIYGLTIIWLDVRYVGFLKFCSQ